jgi:hypothetical protein
VGFCSTDFKDDIIFPGFRHGLCSDFKHIRHHLYIDLLINAFDISSLVF